MAGAERASRGEGGRSWPAWAKGLASAALGFHLLAMLAVALAGNPASDLQRDLVAPFAGYVELIDQGRVHRYYAPAPPPTPILTAELHFGEGEPSRTVRLPDPSVRPRLRYQRQLALANHLFMDYQAGRMDPHADHGRPSRWGPSYARHLCASTPGCTGVTLRVQQHLVPDLVRLGQMAGPGGRLPDVDAPQFFTVPEVVGDYPCDGR